MSVSADTRINVNVTKVYIACSVYGTFVCTRQIHVLVQMTHTFNIHTHISYHIHNSITNCNECVINKHENNMRCCCQNVNIAC